MTDVTMIRLNRSLLNRMRSTADRHPLKPTLRAAVERGIELMIENLEKEIRNAKQ